MSSNPLPELLKLDASERLAIAEKLWASVSVEEESATSTNDEINFAKKRLELYLKNPSNTVPWSKIREELGL